MRTESATIKELLAEAELSLCHLDTPRLDAEVLLALVLNTGRETLYAHPEKTVAPNLRADFHSLVAKRCDGFPVAYLIGYREFWSAEFLISQDTLIPRPETEHLVETALELIPEHASLNILDMGTGSGVIAITIARNRPRCHITAADISSEALAVARNNATHNGTDNIRFHISDWFSAFGDEVFDMVICNPPYVDSRDAGFLYGDIRHEPRIALDGGHLGMQMINHIVPAARDHLHQGAPLILEHGGNQGEGVRYLFMSNGYAEVETRHDHAGLDRVTLARKNN